MKDKKLKNESQTLSREKNKQTYKNIIKE